MTKTKLFCFYLLISFLFFYPQFVFGDLNEIKYRLDNMPSLPNSNGQVRYMPDYLEEFDFIEEVVYQTVKDPKVYPHQLEMKNFTDPDEIKRLENEGVKFRDYTLNLFLPVEKNTPQKPRVKKRPLVIFMHGGAWRTGSKGSKYLKTGQILSKSGYAVASFDYRIWDTPSVKNNFKVHPNSAPRENKKYDSLREGAVIDLERAVNFLRKNADQWDIDPNRIALVGYSAGAITPMFYNYDAPNNKDREFIKALAVHAGNYGNNKLIEKGEAPICIVTGEEDQIMKYHNVQKIATQCENVGVPYVLNTYIGLGHAIGDMLNNIKKEHAIDSNGFLKYDKQGQPIKNPNYNGDSFTYQYYQKYKNLSIHELQQIKHEMISIPLWVPFLKKHLAPKSNFVIKVNSVENGKIEGDKIQTVKAGTSSTPILAVADEGYKFESWSHGSVENPLVFKNVNRNWTIKPIFEKIELEKPEVNIMTKDITLFDYVSLEVTNFKSNQDYILKKVSGPGAIADLSQKAGTFLFRVDEVGQYKFVLTTSKNGMAASKYFSIEVDSVWQGLQADYSFEEEYGKLVLDHSKFKRDVQMSEGATRSLYGAKGKALNLNRENAYLDLNHLNVLGDQMSISIWVKMAEGQGSGARILSKASGAWVNQRYWEIGTYQNSHKLRFSLKTNGETSVLETEHSLQVGKWEHVVASYNNQAMKLYLNGTLIGRLKKSGLIDVDASVPVWAGHHPPNYWPDSAWKGELDEIKIYNRALSESEINKLTYDRNFQIESVDWTRDDVGWDTYKFIKEYVEPIVIASPVTMKGSDPCHVRIRNVTSRGFEYKVEEWNYSINPEHPADEKIHFLIMEAGQHRIGELVFKATSLKEVNDNWDSVDLEFGIGHQTILTQVVTDHGMPVVSRIKEIEESYFDIRLQEEEASFGQYTSEDLHIIAVQSGSGSFMGRPVEVGRKLIEGNQINSLEFKSNFTNPICFAQISTFYGDNPCGLRLGDFNENKLEIKIEEEKSADDETNHIAEEVRYLIFEN